VKRQLLSPEHKLAACGASRATEQRFEFILLDHLSQPARMVRAPDESKLAEYKEVGRDYSQQKLGIQLTLDPGYPQPPLILWHLAGILSI
jgi:hypothetical protein